MRIVPSPIEAVSASKHSKNRRQLFPVTVRETNYRDLDYPALQILNLFDLNIFYHSSNLSQTLLYQGTPSAGTGLTSSQPQSATQDWPRRTNLKCAYYSKNTTSTLQKCHVQQIAKNTVFGYLLHVLLFNSTGCVFGEMTKRRQRLVDKYRHASSSVVLSELSMTRVDYRPDTRPIRWRLPRSSRQTTLQRYHNKDVGPKDVVVFCRLDETIDCSHRIHGADKNAWSRIENLFDSSSSVVRRHCFLFWLTKIQPKKFFLPCFI